MKNRTLKLSLLLVICYVVGWFSLFMVIYAFFHTKSQVTTEVLSFYEKIFIPICIFMILVPLISIVLAILYRIKRIYYKFWSYLILAIFSTTIFVFEIIFAHISDLLYKLVYFFDAL